MFQSNFITTLFILLSFSAFSQSQGFLFMEMTSATPFQAQKSAEKKVSFMEENENVMSEASMERQEAMQLEDVEVAKSIDNVVEEQVIMASAVQRDPNIQVIEEEEMLKGLLEMPNRVLDEKVKEGVDEYARAKVEEMKPKAIQKMASNGTFKVDAWKDFGYTFRNVSMDTLNVCFSISTYERWSFSDYGITFAAGGVEQKNVNTLRYGHLLGALTAVKENGKYRSIGTDGKMNVMILPNESITFVMNDMKGSYSDNSGSVVVKWNLK